MPNERVLVIEGGAKPKRIDWTELWAYRDLLWFLVWRDIRVRYSQSVLGIGWAVAQPLFSMAVYTVILGKLAKVSSDGAPYAIFSFAALVPWTYFANVLQDSSASVVNSQNLITKVHFPRLVLPLSSVFSKLIDFAIASVLLAVLLVWYRITPNWAIVFLPVLLLMLCATAAGMGMWLASLSIQYRDVRFAMSFAVQLLMYAAPVVYPSSIVPPNLRPWYELNPMVGVIEGFRSSLLGTIAMPWRAIGVGAVVAVLLFVTGTRRYRRAERLFADLV